jgi:hypothetical protein
VRSGEVGQMRDAKRAMRSTSILLTSGRSSALGSLDYYVAPDGNKLNVWVSADPAKPLASPSIDLGETGFIRGAVILEGGRG